MPKIHLLSEELINKIAAGEVIERPASVVKELVENSLDAGSTSIIVNIEDSGKKLIRVRDNGEGMDEEDARNSVLRHATSKIQKEEDLFAIATLGFRGEALASIAAVSKLSILTKQQQTREGFNLIVEGGSVVSSSVIPTERGTTIEVHNLFFNTPARKKFLKTDSVELRHIIDVVTHYALLHPIVSFKLFHGGNQLLHAPVIENARDNIASIYGVHVAKDLLEISYTDETTSISGFISTPYTVRNDRQQQVLFVNNRWVRSEEITNAVYKAYHSLLFVNKHPLFVLHLHLDSCAIDVNVHPQKSEIKIEQKEQVCFSVEKAVKETLQKNNLIPLVDVEFERQMQFRPVVKKSVQKNDGKYTFEQSKQEVFHVKEESPDQSAKASLPLVLGNNILPLPRSFPIMRILGQIHKTFFVAETQGGAYFIDQHAAQERVLYEQFMGQFMKEKVEVQYLLQGEIIEFLPGEKELVEDGKEVLERFGFFLEPFGEKTFLLKTVPLIFGRVQQPDFFYEVLTFLKEGKEKILERKEEIVTRMACRSAVMAGEVLTIQQMEAIINDLAKTELPYACPHGRPTLFKISAEELEKKFRRKG